MILPPACSCMHPHDSAHLEAKGACIARKLRVCALLLACVAMAPKRCEA